jgi:DNA-binding SARP family transcriptional activator
VEFGLLGPLVVRAGGATGKAEVRISAGNQRVLLAVLLLRANLVVPLDELAQLVWQGDPPGKARVTLQNYVKRLRHALGPAGHERIVTCPDGYLIKVGPAELDLTQFTELQAAGLAAARAGEWEAAAARLSAALRLWRGEPLSGVPSGAVRALADMPRLAGMRLEALETRFDAELHLGRHREVIADLQALAAAAPLRERPAELLMLALYRSGQQDAALAVYRHVRRQLVDQAGLEPGPGLRELNQRILQSDPALLPAAPAEALAGSPAMLPAALPGFAGRAGELRALSALPVSPGGALLITAIGGTAGVGKTALAVRWAREHAFEFPDGQLYLNLRGFSPGEPVPPAEALRIFLGALRVPGAHIPRGLDDRQALYRSLLEGKKTLILLDNARDAAQVRPLLPGSPGCRVLVTSRNDLTGLIASDGAQPIVLDILSRSEAQELLASRIGHQRLDSEPAAADELVNLCARLPLALAVTAARAVARPQFPLAFLAAELRDTRARLDALATGEDATDPRAVFSWSYQQLTPEAARMFRLLGLHPGPDVTAPAGASLAATTPGQARRTLLELTRAHLLTEHSPGRYAFHDLLRAYAVSQADAAEDAPARQAATGRVLDHYLHTANAAALLLEPLRQPATLPPALTGVTAEPLADHNQALAWFEAEHQVLLSAVALAAETGFGTCACELPGTMATFLDRAGHWREWAAIQHTAVEAAVRTSDPARHAAALRALAFACTRLADYDQARAHLSDCLRLYREAGDRAGEARTQQSLSWVADRQERPADALAHAERALALFKAIGHRAGQAAALNSVGWCHALLSNRQARPTLRRSLLLHRELGDRSGEALTWDSLGYAEHTARRFAEAASCYQHAVDILSELGDRYHHARSLTRLGDTCAAAQDAGQAWRAWQQALAILDDLHHPDADQARDKLRRLGRANSQLRLRSA